MTATKTKKAPAAKATKKAPKKWFCRRTRSHLTTKQIGNKCM